MRMNKHGNGLVMALIVADCVEWPWQPLICCCMHDSPTAIDTSEVQLDDLLTLFQTS